VLGEGAVAHLEGLEHLQKSNSEPQVLCLSGMVSSNFEGGVIHSFLCN
jgi:hypothetical protein